jgi:hypothetical protein
MLHVYFPETPNPTPPPQIIQTPTDIDKAAGIGNIEWPDIEGLAYLVFGDIAFAASSLFLAYNITSERSERVYWPKINEIAAKAIST